MRVTGRGGSILMGGIVAALLSLLVGMAVATAQTTTSSSTTSSTSGSTSTSTTLARTTTSTSVAPVAATTTSSSTSTTVAPKSKDESGLSDTALILIAAIVVLLLVVLLVVLLMRRRAHDLWRQDARAAVTDARQLSQVVTRGLATLDQPSAAAQTWAEVEHLGSQVHSRFLALMAKSPTPQLGGAVSGADRSLQALRAAVESDRTLRLGPPPPTEAQLSYSAAVVRERATEFNQAVDELSGALTER